MQAVTIGYCADFSVADGVIHSVEKLEMLSQYLRSSQ